MIKLTIVSIGESTYTLKSENKTYEVVIQFYGDKVPKVNDVIYIPSKILNEINIYAYGPLNSVYSKNMNATEEELIKVVTETEEYYLQRYYG